jgi:peptidoglycan/LPS O-acetylase OafA/YrhL
VRNRYLDLLRAAAIVRVIVYHLFGWPWLSILLPAMGIMFALAGSLTAASLDKRAARRVVASRLRRLLPPLWLLGLIAVPVMLVAGWQQEVDGDHPFSVARLAFWLLPLGDPPGSDKGVDVWEPLWYLRAYVWFILLSPLLYLAYRRIGWLAVAAPLALMAILDKTGFSLPDTADAAMWDFATYGACWITGFAHHDGRLARLRPWVVIVAAAVLGAAAVYWLRGHQGEDAWDLNDVSESQALWSVAFVLLALRWQPSMRWLNRARPLSRAVTLLNARAVTVYLWHNIAIALVWPTLAVLTLDDLGHLEGPVDLVVAILLTGAAVLAFGWAEDLAAKRRPRLWPADGPGPHPEPVAIQRSPMPALVGADRPAVSGAPAAGDGAPGDGLGSLGPDDSGAPASADGAPGGRATSSGTDRPVVFGAKAHAGPSGRSGVTAALSGRSSAAAALTRLPAAGSPAPRPGDGEAAVAGRPAGRHQSGDVGGGDRDLQLPVAGRRAAPFDGADLTTGGAGPAGEAESTAGSGPANRSGAAGKDASESTSEPRSTSGPEATSEPGSASEPEATSEPRSASGPEATSEPGSASKPEATSGPWSASEPEATSGPGSAGESAPPGGSGSANPSITPAEEGDEEVWNGEGTGRWAATGPILGTPSHFGWTDEPDEPTTTREPSPTREPARPAVSEVATLPAQPTGPPQPSRPAEPIEPGHPAVLKQPTQPDEPTRSDTPTWSAESAGPVESARSARSVESARSGQGERAGRPGGDAAGGGPGAGPWPRRAGVGGGSGGVPDWFRQRRDDHQPED